MIVVRIRDGIVDHLPLRWPEWFMTGMLLQFGAKLLMSGETFASSHSYDLMADFSRVVLPWADPETAWGTTSAVICSIRIFSLTANGTFDWFARWSPTARAILAFLSALSWFLIATGMFFSNRNGTGSGTYYGLMSADIILAIVIAGDAGKALRRQRRGPA